jgi:hypothetical protein
MKCPRCGEEILLTEDKCVHCGLSLEFTAGATFDRPAEEDTGTELGLKLVRPVAGLLILACVLYFGIAFVGGRPDVKLNVGEPPIAPPEPKVAIPRPKLPEELRQQVKLIEPEPIALPAPSALPRVRPSFGSRDARVRQLFLERNGGDARTEAAVKLGLEWLSRSQSDDGSWDYKKYGVDEKNREGQDHTLGLSGLALLAFLGAGHNHQDPGPFKETVAKALQYVLRAQDKEGRFPGQLYTQGICTMALVEAYGLTGDTTLLQPATQGVQAIVAAQNRSGGWDYGPGGARGDTSVTGWQVMALKSARKVGIEFPDDAYKRAMDFLTGISREDGSVGYEVGGQAVWRTTSAMTAVGLNALLFMAVEPADPRVQKAVSILLANLPRPPRQQGATWKPGADIYFWYHGCLALTRLGGQEWKVWNERVKGLLLSLQDKEGDLKGSWRPYGDPWSDRTGRLFFTSLAIMALEVYYRYD